MNLHQLRRLEADAEAAIRGVSIVKLASMILFVFAVTLAAMPVLALLTGLARPRPPAHDHRRRVGRRRRRGASARPPEPVVITGLCG